MTEKKKSYCCRAFEEKARDDVVGRFEQEPKGTWNINGCCGGGCFVVFAMKFCPFCGAKL